MWRLSTRTDRRRGRRKSVEGEHGDRQQERKKEEVWRVSTGTDSKGGRRMRRGG